MLTERNIGDRGLEICYESNTTTKHWQNEDTRET